MCDDHEGTKNDTKVDFDYDTNGPATCSECGRQFPVRDLNPADTDPVCPSCKYPDWCDICGDYCVCDDNEPEDELD